MKDFLKTIAMLLHMLLVVILLTCCYSGLYQLWNVASPKYRNDRDALRADAGLWGMAMTGLTFLALLALAVISVVFHESTMLFIETRPEVLVAFTWTYVVVLCVGLLSALCFVFID